MQKIIDRSKPPVPGIPKDVVFPDYEKVKISNGIEIIVVEDKRLPLVTARFLFKTGALYDAIKNDIRPGLTSLTSELITKGTNKNSATELAELIDFHGAHMSAGADYESISLNIYCLSKYFEKIFEIASEIIQIPAFSDEEIERIKIQRINSLISNFDDGEYIAGRLFKSEIHKNSPYSINIDGTGNSVNSLQKNDFVNYHDMYFTPENLLIAFVGDINVSDAVKISEKYFSGLKVRNIDRISFESPATIKGKKVFIAERKQAVQSDIVLGHISTKRKNPDYISLMVMNTILGGFFTSRINKNLREVNGYTYGAHSYFNCYKMSGEFSVETSVGNIQTVSAIKEIIKEIDFIKEFPVGETELTNAKNYIIGNFMLQLETANAIASKIIYLNLFELEDDFYSHFISKINDVTVNDVKNAAEKYLNSDNITVAVAGVSEEILSEMEQIGDTKVLNYTE